MKKCLTLSIISILRICILSWQCYGDCCQLPLILTLIIQNESSSPQFPYSIQIHWSLNGKNLKIKQHFQANRNHDQLCIQAMANWPYVPGIDWIYGKMWSGPCPNQIDNMVKFHFFHTWFYAYDLLPRKRFLKPNENDVQRSREKMKRNNQYLS